MSYASINKCAHDGSLFGRLVACSASEGEDPPEPAATAVIWDLACASDVEAAYESALIAENPDPGGDPTVITDQMILSNFQAHRPTA